MVVVKPENLRHSARATSLATAHASIRTPEHLLAALAILGISSIDIDIDSEEVPILDGSALPFVTQLEKIGAQNLSIKRPVVPIHHPISLTSGAQRLLIVPDTQYSRSYIYEGDTDQTMWVNLNDPTTCADVISARTFGNVSELAALQKLGLGLGASIENAIGLSDAGPSTPFRSPNELAAHKLLDLIGDFSVFGSLIQGHIIGIGSGHVLNAKMVQHLAQMPGSAGR